MTHSLSTRLWVQNRKLIPANSTTSVWCCLLEYICDPHTFVVTKGSTNAYIGSSVASDIPMAVLHEEASAQTSHKTSFSCFDHYHGDFWTFLTHSRAKALKIIPSTTPSTHHQNLSWCILVQKWYSFQILYSYSPPKNCKNRKLSSGR